MPEPNRKQRDEGSRARSLPRSSSEILLQSLPRLKYNKTGDLCGSIHEAILPLTSSSMYPLRMGRSLCALAGMLTFTSTGGQSDFVALFGRVPRRGLNRNVAIRPSGHDQYTTIV